MPLRHRVIQVAPVEDNPDALFVGIREFPTKRIILVAPPSKMTEAKELEKRLAPLKLPVNIIELTENGSILESIFEVFARLNKSEGSDAQNIVVNVATGDRLSACGALSASYVNGLRAFSVENDQITLLPMLRFSFDKLVSEKKTEIVRVLSFGESLSFEELASKLGVSSPLLSYHLNGDRDTSGLIELGLVEFVGTMNEAENDENPATRGKKIRLTSLGKLFFRGYC